MIYRGILAFAMVFNVFACHANDAEVWFEPEENTMVAVKLINRSISYEVKGHSRNFVTTIPHEVESISHIVVGDFNFDGKKDFEIWYLDEGMGKYTVHRLFIYISTKRGFIEVFPSCGDEFISMGINRKNKFILSTYFLESSPKRCVTRLKNKY